LPAEQFVINVRMTGDRATVASAGRVTAATREMGAAAAGASATSAKAASTTAQKWSSAGATATAAGKKMTKGITLPVLAIGAVSGKMAVDFEKSMRNVNSIAQLPEPAFKRLNKEVLAMAGPTAQAPKTLAEGLYDLVSSGFDAHESIQVLNASARAATAGLTTTEVSTKAVAAALNAYHRPAADAKQISDDLFNTVNLGVVTFDELASTIGYVLPAAATMGVGIKQVGASISTLTKEGQSSSNAVTNINAALTAFIKPSKAMHSVLKELGFETSQQLITQKGFQGGLELVTNAVHGNKEAIGKLFPNVRAMRAVFGLTGDAAKGAGEDLRGFQHDTGATAKVLHEQQKSIAYQWNQLKAEASVLAINLGNKLIPVMHDVAQTVGGMVKSFTELPPDVQTTTIKILAFGAAMGPILTIGGTFAKVIGGVLKGFKLLAGTSIVSDVVAALSMKGERLAALNMVGSDMAGGIAGGLVKFAPWAAAGAGVVNILSSVIGGDSKGALEKTGGAAGGALIGGLLGSVIPGAGTVAGALIGGGIGSFLGPTITSIFEGEKKLTPMQHRLQASSKGLTTAMHNERDAAKGLADSNRNLHSAKQRQANASKNVRNAEHQLNEALRQHKRNTLPVLEAELRLAQAKHQNAKATREVRAAERLQGYERKIQMPIMRTTILETRHRINVLKDERKQLREQAKQMVENGSTEKQRVDWMKRMRQNSSNLATAEKKKNEVLADAAKLIGPKFARALENASKRQIEVANAAQSTGRTVHQYYGDMAEAVFGFRKVSENSGKRVQGVFAKTKGALGPFRQETHTQMQRAGGDVWDFAHETKTAFGQVETSTNSVLGGLGVKSVNFGLDTPRQKKARGGLVRIPGQGKQDTVPLNVMGVPVVAAPGEDIAFLTEHQRADLDFAVKHVFGDNGLSHFFHRQDRPHYMARGGVVEPRLSGPDPMQEAGQHAIHQITKAARAYIRRVGGDKSFKALVDNGNRMDALKQPYLWGGGHGSTPSRNGPWDCSGGTSELFYGAGWKDLSPMVSSGFEGFGEPGQGKVSILANGEHVYSVLGNRAIGTSSENPGGGFGWINGYTYRPGFTVRHVDLMGEGLPSAQRRGRGQKPAKGFAKGGWVRTGYTTYDIDGPGAYGDLMKGHGYAELGTGGVNAGGAYLAKALGRSGELPKDFPLEVKVGSIGKVATLYKRDKGSGQDSSFYSIDIHHLAWPDVGLHGNSKGVAYVRETGGAGGKAEDVPAVFAGARTGSIDFPSVPKTMHGVNREIAKWQSTIAHYRRALHKAKGKPKIEAALQKNIVAIENHLKQLRRQRALLRRKAAQKKVTKRLRRQLGKIMGVERSMEEAERAYTEADQYASQIVDLEPVQAGEGEANEAKYIQAFTDYVEQAERPAYQHVLDSLASWRNLTLHGEGVAGQVETGFEREVRSIERDIDQINAFTKKVGDDKQAWREKHPKEDFPKWLKDEIAKEHKERSRLPMLRFRDREVRKVLGEARSEFYPGRKDPIAPPAPPMAGTGSIEEVLVGIQGTHWPDQHAPLAGLPGKRVAGQFGGYIWDAQGAIEELGLKIQQVSGAGIGGQDNSEREQLLEEENLRLKREKLVHAAQAPVLANYLGAYKTGGILPADGFYLGHKDETVIPANSSPLSETHVHIHDRGGVLERLIEVEVERRMTSAGRSIGLARATPSAPGRRAVLSQGRRSR